jgi:CHASE2 domain-containing sensor protein
MEWLKKIGKSLLVGTVAGVLIALITNYFVPALIDRLENQSYYMRYLWKYMDTDKNEDKNQAPESSICIVDIDDVTQIKMGVYWSWNRSYHAQLINNLDKQFPGAIVFDILPRPGGLQPHPPHRKAARIQPAPPSAQPADRGAGAVASVKCRLRPAVHRGDGRKRQGVPRAAVVG